MKFSNNKKEVFDYLEQEPRFRERSNRERGIINLLLKRYPKLAEVGKDTLIEFCHDFTSMDRCWRKILEEKKSFRGSDYQDKEELEEEARLDLGYKG